MELFTLGADRGAYTEDDVRELARALTGWRNDWSAELGEHNFRFDPDRHDTGTKTVFGRTGNYDWRDACGLCLDTPCTPPSSWRSCGATSSRAALGRRPARALEQTYVAAATRCARWSRRSSAPPAARGPADGQAARGVPGRDAAPPAPRRRHRRLDLARRGQGQRLFHPPNVAGWDDDRWLDTSTLRGALVTRGELLRRPPHPRGAHGRLRPDARPRSRRCAGARLLGRTRRSPPTGWPRSPASPPPASRPSMANWQQRHYRAHPPERPAAADRHLPRPSDELTDGLRTRIQRRAELRRAAARASRAPGSCAAPHPRRCPARGLPAIEPGMPTPAGTGLTRRSFISRTRRAGAGRLRRERARLGGLRGGHRRRGQRRRPSRCWCRSSWRAAPTR